MDTSEESATVEPNTSLDLDLPRADVNIENSEEGVNVDVGLGGTEAE